ncbi:MAG: AEC family transporter [Candidatus Anstonellales archaeon]
MLELLVFFIIGYILKNFMKDNSSIFDLLYFVIYPAAIIYGMLNIEFNQNLLIFPITYIIIGIINIHIFETLGNLLSMEKYRIGATILSIPIVNSGVVYSIGYILEGEKGLVKMVVYTLGDLIVIPYSQLIASRYAVNSSKTTDLSSILISPINLAITIGTLIFLLNIQIPEFIVQIISKLSSMITPLVMIGLGSSINTEGLLSKTTVGLIILRTVIASVVSLLIAILSSLSYSDTILLMAASISSLGFVGTVIARQIGLDYRFSAALVFISIITLFPILFIINILW